jgi:4-methyl-5(b-hydroxyethyl)-thiazole monophosphate biosynthesis
MAPYYEKMEKIHKKVGILLAPGFEEVEAVTPIDYLRRAGITVETVAVNEGPDDTERLLVKGSHGIPLAADMGIIDALQSAFPLWDGVLLPGGIPGAPNLAASARVNELVGAACKAGKLVCAICAAPAVVLAPLGVLHGRRFACYPGYQEKVPEGVWVDAPVAVDRTVITATGAGTAALWALAIIRALLDGEAAKKVAGAVLL